MNTFYHGDCLLVMKKDIDPESVDLIYLDPPFFTGKVQKGKWQPGEMPLTYDDGKIFWKDKGIAEHASVWLKYIANDRPDFAAYLFYMTERLDLCKRVLKPTGSIYLHCDWRASHYLKMLMDDIFGFNNFQNEIIWHYRSGAGTPKRYGRKHDCILYYTKTSTYTFNADSVRVPYAPATLCRLKYNGAREHNIEKVLMRGGRLLDDVWDIEHLQGNTKSKINPATKESTGYPTQKPTTLLERIILASSNEGDVILDPFCGCGTTIVVAQFNKRSWIGIDINKEAYNISHARELQLTLGTDGGAKYISRDFAEVKAMSPNEFERWVNEFYKATKPYPDKEVDGITQKGVPIQTKTSQNGVDSPEIHTFNSAILVHPKLQGIDIKEGIFASQNGFTNRARQVVSEIEDRGGIKIRLVTLEEMLK